MTKLVLAGVFIALLCIAAGAQQDVRPVPGPGTGIVKVTGTVDVGTLPPVEAAQRGDWKVAVTSTPHVVLAAPEFVKVGAVYDITWSDGVQEAASIEQILAGGWVRTAGTEGRRRWVNLAAARSLQERR